MKRRYVKYKKTAHSFRHSFATLAQENGVDIQRIEELQGRHYTKQTVGQQIYIGATSIKTLSIDIERIKLNSYLIDAAPFASN